MSSPSCTPAFETYALGSVRRSCEHLKPLKMLCVLRTLGIDTTQDEPSSAATLYSRIDPGNAMAIWVADLLTRCPVTDPDAVTLLWEEFVPHLRKIGTDIHRVICGARRLLPTTQLVFLDRTKAAVTGSDRFYDIQTGKWVDQLDQPAFEQVSYNLTQLFLHRHNSVAEN